MRLFHSIDPFLEQIRSLPFVKGLEFSRENRAVDSGADGFLKVRTTDGAYVFEVEQKRSYLDRGILNALVAQAKHSDKKSHVPILLLARFIPKPSAERLIDAGVNFLDQVGNMHLVLGRNYERTIIGKRNGASKEGPRVSPASTQLLFTFATTEEAGPWPVRQLAEASGLSKSTVANVRQQLVDREILKKSGRNFEVRDKKRFQEELLRGYEIALRPKLLIGLFTLHIRIWTARLRKSIRPLAISRFYGRSPVDQPLMHCRSSTVDWKPAYAQNWQSDWWL